LDEFIQIGNIVKRRLGILQARQLDLSVLLKVFELTREMHVGSTSTLFEFTGFVFDWVWIFS